MDMPACNFHKRHHSDIKFTHVYVDFVFYGIIELLVSVRSPMMLLTYLAMHYQKNQNYNNEKKSIFLVQHLQPLYF